MASRRERPTMIGHVLRAISRAEVAMELRPTRVARASNLPYDRFVDILGELRAARFVEAHDPPRLTPRGLEALRRFEAWQLALRHVEEPSATPPFPEGEPALSAREFPSSPPGVMSRQAGPDPQDDLDPAVRGTFPSIPTTHPSRSAARGGQAVGAPLPMIADATKRRLAALQEITDATRLIDVARRTVYGVPDLFLVRVELAVQRLRRLERFHGEDQSSVRAPGTVAFPKVEPLDLSARTKKAAPRRGADAGGTG